MGTILFDAVLFDLDGTLAATDRFWPEAADVGARRAFRELGIERALPSSEEWMGMVGLPLAQAFDAVFADLSPRERGAVMERCVEEEELAIRAHGVALLPGVAVCLDALAAAGVRLGIASNCGQDYLDAMLEGLDLARWIEAPRCLSSPGVENKADMVEDLLATFDTRSAVMVGDRQGDRDAAWANGLPHVHLTRGFAPRGERFACEATLAGLDGLVPLLEGRARGLDAIADALAGAHTIGVVGGRLAGRSLLARDLERRVSERGPGQGTRVQVHEGRGQADGVVHVSAPAHVVERRIHGREGRLAGLAAAEALAHRMGSDPGADGPRAGDLRVDGGDPLAPRILPGP